MSERHTCPRRIEQGTHIEDSPFRGSGPNLDTYESGRGMSGQERGCSYCGSMPPDDFMQAVRSGAVVGPTDKSYKVYMHEAPTAEQVAAAAADPEMLSHPHGKSLGKFYTPHLAPAHSEEFVALWKAGQIHWGYPGYPYARLYLPGLAPQEPTPDQQD